MKVDVLEPKGYCAGVKNAINIALKAKKEHPSQNVYILGHLVHNDTTINLLKEQNICVLDTNKTDIETLINSLNENDVIVFPAHGHNPHLNLLAKAKKLIVYDATCPVVSHNIKTIQDKIAQGYKVIFIGKENHPETKAMLSLSKDVVLWDENILLNNQISTNSNIFVANQTTLNYASLSDIHKKITSTFPYAITQNEVCQTTRLRQESLQNIPSTCDLILIVGSNYSNNTQELLHIAKKYYPSTDIYLIDSLDSLKRIPLQNKKHTVISSGASSPPFIIDVIKNYLENL